MADHILTIPHIDRKTLARIFGKIRVDSGTGCWLWTGTLISAGYGGHTLKRRPYLAHRLLYAWLVEPLPCGRSRNVPQLDHIACDTKRCCNPAHLRLVTLKQNLMRGNGPTAINARKTVCRRGHPLPATANAVGPQGPYRRCPTCAAAQAAAYQPGYRKRYWLANKERITALRHERAARLRDRSTGGL